jgi:ParB family chromosome partitioning protein
MSTKKRKGGDLNRAAVFEAILGDLGVRAETPIDEGLKGGVIAIADILFPDRQPRRFIDPEGLVALAASIRERGVLEPVLVRPAGLGYELIAGERRTRAAQSVGLTHIPAVVLELDDREALEISIIENLQREDLNAVEETEAVLQLLELSVGLDRGGALGLLAEQVQEARGRSPQVRFEASQKAALAGLFERLGRFTPASFLANRVPILSFPEELLQAVRSGRLEFTKAQALARVDHPDDRQQLIEEAVSKGLTLSQIRRRITELRADEKSAKPVNEVVLERAHVVRRLLQRRNLAGLSEEELKRVGRLLDEVAAMFER